MILIDFPQAGPDACVSQDALVDYRRKYVKAILEEERGEVSELEKVVIEAVSHEDTLSQTPGEREADHLRLSGSGRRTKWHPLGEVGGFSSPLAS